MRVFYNSLKLRIGNWELDEPVYLLRGFQLYKAEFLRVETFIVMTVSNFKGGFQFSCDLVHKKNPFLTPLPNRLPSR